MLVSLIVCVQCGDYCVIYAKICTGNFELIDIIWSQSCLEVIGLSFRLEPSVFTFGLHLQHHWSHIQIYRMAVCSGVKCLSPLHEQFPVYWNVTLDWMLSYKVNVIKTAAVLKSRNCLLFKLDSTRMWADVQRDGRAVEYRWHPLFNAAKFGRLALLEYWAVTLPRRETRWNYLGCPKLPDRYQSLVGRSSPYIMRTCEGHIAA